MRTYPGLADDVDTALALVAELGQIVTHLGAAGVRADGQKAGAKVDAVNVLKAEFLAMKAAIPKRELAYAHVHDTLVPTAPRSQE